MEKVWAERAGLGWIGKNGLLINRELGSWLTLSVMFLDRAVDVYDQPHEPLCGDCERCLKGCPTGAFPSPGGGRRAPVPLVPVDREQGPRPRKATARLRGPRLRLRHLPGRLPLEYPRDPRRRPPLRAPPAVRAVAGGDGGAERGGFQGPVGRHGRGPRPVRRLPPQRPAGYRRAARRGWRRGVAAVVRGPESGGGGGRAVGVGRLGERRGGTE